MKFSEVSELWLQDASIDVSWSWKNQLESNVNHLNKAIGSKDIQDILPCDLSRLLKTLSLKNPNTNKPASKRLLKSITSVASQIFEFAIENRITNYNPALTKSAKKIPKKATVKEVFAVDENQQTLIMEFDHPAKLATVIMMFMGLRAGELLALKWSDIDLDRQVVHVVRSCSRISSNRFEIKKGTKNGKVRDICIPGSIIDYLTEKKKEANTSLVLTNRHRNLHTPTSWRSYWNAYQNELNYYTYRLDCLRNGVIPKNKFCPTGIPDMNVRFNAHQLRHTFATMLYKSKVDVLTAKELLGHSDVKTTLGIYTHLDEQFKKVSILQYDDYIQNKLLKASSL